MSAAALDTEVSDGIDGGLGHRLNAWALDLNPTTGREDQMDNIIDTTDFWNPGPECDNSILSSGSISNKPLAY